MKRTLILIGVVLVVVAVAAVGWIAGSRIKSPEQVAAEAEPPEASLITVPIERLIISSDVVTRGDVRFDQPESILSQGVALLDLAPIITWVPEPGSEVVEGSLLYEVSGRPVFALGGELPLFRDLTRGSEGEDIAQFQQALIRLGFDPGDVDGVYGEETEAAAAAFYAAAGYEILEPTDQEVEALEALREVTAAAQRLYTEARQASDRARAAERALSTAAIDLAAASATLAEKQAALEEAIDRALPPEGNKMAQLTTAVTKAQAAYDAAFETHAEAQLANEVAAGEAGAFDLEDAQRNLTQAQEDQRTLENRTGRRVPTAEIVFFELFPLRVDTVNVTRGDAAGGEIMKVSGSRLAIDSSVPVADAEPIEVGDEVIIDLRSRGIEVTGTITIKGDRPGTNGVDSQRIYLEIVPDEVRAELNEANVRITIPVESSGGEVLAVPAAAISAAADGSAQIQIEDDGGTTRFVTVTPGLSSRGLVQITAVDGEIAEGDRVVVGTS